MAKLQQVVESSLNELAREYKETDLWRSQCLEFLAVGLSNFAKEGAKAKLHLNFVQSKVMVEDPYSWVAPFRNLRVIVIPEDSEF